LEKITVKLTSPRDYTITDGNKIITVRATRQLNDDELRRPLREYEEILVFIENFEIIQKEEIKSEIPDRVAQGIKTQIDDILYPKSESVSSSPQNVQAYNTLVEQPESDKLLPTSKDISRIEEKYNNLMSVAFPNEEKVSKPALALKQMLVHNLISTEEADKLQKQFDLDMDNIMDSTNLNLRSPPYRRYSRTHKRQEMIVRNHKEFTSDDIVSFFGNMGYDKTRIRNNVGHDIKALKEKNKIRMIMEVTHENLLY